MVKKSTDEIKALAAFPSGGDGQVRAGLPAGGRNPELTTGAAQGDPVQTLARIHVGAAELPTRAASECRPATEHGRGAEARGRTAGGEVGPSCTAASVALLPRAALVRTKAHASNEDRDSVELERVQAQTQATAPQITQSELEFQEQMIAEREGEIREIESGIHELNDIFRDLGAIVQEQGGLIGESPLLCPRVERVDKRSEVVSRKQDS